MISTLPRRIALLALTATTACSELSVQKCALRCDERQHCALGLTCGDDGYCHREDDLTTCAAIGDGGVAGAYNFMFITSQTYSPGSSEFHSIADGDRICAELASASTIAGVAGKTYVAWLSDSSANAIDRLRLPGTTTDARGWLRPDGRPFADSLRPIGTSPGLQGGQIFYPPRVDENGHDLVAFDSSDVPAPVATGTAPGGLASNATAQNWSSSNADYTVGTGAGTTRLWSSAFVFSGATPKVHLYCFGIDLASTLTPPPSTGRVAFLSRGAFAPQSGVAAADQLCNDEAMAATPPLAGTFTALLNRSSAAAASLFSDGAPWVRLDGIVWAETLSAAGLRTSLNVDTERAYRADIDVWTGITSAGPNAAGTATCADWTSASSTDKGAVGEAPSSSARLFFHDTPSCATQSHSVYCLQN